MAKPLLVPGTQASTLVDRANGDAEIYNAVRVGLPLVGKSLGGLPKDEWVAVMSMEHTPGQIAPARTSLQAGRDLGVGEVSRTPYDLLSYEGWGYDWRADMRWNAERLVDDLEARLVREGERADLIGHSQGGLIIVLASKAAGAARWERLVSKAVLVGSPLAGTLNALEALLPGSASLGGDNRLLARDMARTWPALYQMLPAWPCIQESDGDPRPAHHQVLELQGWPGQGGITADMLDRAIDAHALLRNPFAEFGGVAVRSFLGSNHTTPQALVRDGDEEGLFEHKEQSGDSLVPHARTMGWGDQPYHDSVRIFGKNTQNHARLCVDVHVATRIRKFLEN
jgi:pimeloyl-ACP methyl ester carboxylesterase